jgi:hypothetical protein
MKFIKSKYIMLLMLFVGVLTIGGCEEEQLVEYDFTIQQLAAKQLVGTWSTAENIETPVGVPGSIFQTLKVLFGVDENGNPDKFNTEGSSTVFVAGANSTWEWADASTTKNVLLKGVDPITKITVDTSVKDKLTIVFVSDWQDTEGNSGTNAQFEVTLDRQKN